MQHILLMRNSKSKEIIRFQVGHGLSGGAFEAILFRAGERLHLCPSGGELNSSTLFVYDQNRSILIIKMCYRQFIQQGRDNIY